MSRPVDDEKPLYDPDDPPPGAIVTPNMRGYELPDGTVIGAKGRPLRQDGARGRKNLKPNVKGSEQAREMGRRGRALQLAKRDALIAEITERLGAPPGKPPTVTWNRETNDTYYVGRLFPSPWNALYYQTYLGFSRQYAPKGRETMQYRVMLQRVSALYTLIMMMEAGAIRADDYVKLKTDGELRGYISQLQKYTEAEKKEFIIREEIVVTTLTKVVAIGEATIQDARQRAAFMRGLAALVTGDPVQAAPQLLSEPVIDVEPRETSTTGESAS